MARFAAGFRLAPVAALFARLVRLRPACTGCDAFQLTPQELSPDSHRKLSPPAAPSDSPSSLRRRLFLPALLPIKPPACAGRSIFQLLPRIKLQLSPEPLSLGTANNVPPAFTGCPIVSLRWRPTSSFRLRPYLPASLADPACGLHRPPCLPLPLDDSLRLAQNLGSFGTSGSSLPACASCSAHRYVQLHCSQLSPGPTPLARPLMNF